VAAHHLRRVAERSYRLITTNHVVAESYTLIRMRLGHRPAHEFLGRLRSSAQVERVFVPEAWETEAESLLDDFADQDFSYVDAVSFITMRRLRLNTAFAFDHHFTVAGFLLARVEDGSR
jgi:uncharacterized protein